MEKVETDFQKIRRKRTAARTARRAMAILLVAALTVAGAVALRNMEYMNIATWFSDMYSSFRGGPGFPQQSPGSTTLQMLALGKDPVILTDTNLIVYNSSGRMVSTFQHGCRTPVSRTGGGKILTFDQGGKKLRIDTRTKNMYTQEYPRGIISAAISQSGNVAVATASDRYQAEVKVYNAAFEELFTWYTSDYLIYDLALSANGKNLAVIAASAKGGEISSQIVLFNSSQDKPVSVIDIPGEVVTSAVFDSDKNLQVVTDTSARLYTADGKEKGNYSFSGMHLLAFDNNPKGQVTVALDSFGDGNDLTILNFSEKFTKQNKASAPGPVLCLKNTMENIMLLTENGLIVLSTDLSQKEEVACGDAFLCTGSETDIYTISPGSIVKEEMPKFKTK